MEFAQDRQRIYSEMRNDYAKKLIIFGSLQLAFGCLIIIFQAVYAGITAYLIGLSWMMWMLYAFFTAFIFISSGSLGIVGGKLRSRMCVITFNALSIFSACLTVPVLASSIISWKLIADIRRDHPNYEPPAGQIALASLLVITAVAEAIVAIWSSVICCKIGACCSDCIDRTGSYPIISSGQNQQVAYGSC